MHFFVTAVQIQCIFTALFSDAWKITIETNKQIEVLVYWTEYFNLFRRSRDKNEYSCSKTNVPLQTVFTFLLSLSDKNVNIIGSLQQKKMYFFSLSQRAVFEICICNILAYPIYQEIFCKDNICKSQMSLDFVTKPNF